MSYAKLFSSITESSLWSEPVAVRLLFVSMLAKADAQGFVEAAVPGLARISNLPLDVTQEALAVLEAPDPQSKNPENEGRRLTKVPGGWVILNYETYRNRRGEDERREYMRQYMADYRRKQSVNTGKQKLTAVNHGKPRLAQAEAEAEAKNKVVGTGSIPRQSNPAPLAPPTTGELAQDFGGEEPEPEAGQERRPVPANGKEVFRRMKQELLKADTQPATKPKPEPPPADPFPPKLVPVRSESGTIANHPDLETVTKHFTGRFSRDQVKNAFLSFEAAKDGDGNWLWGRRMVGDWRAAIERRINDDMDRRPSGNTAKSAEDILMKMSREGLQ